jgi:hypothetical protein
VCDPLRIFNMCVSRVIRCGIWGVVGVSYTAGCVSRRAVLCLVGEVEPRFTAHHEHCDEVPSERNTH